MMIMKQELRFMRSTRCFYYRVDSSEMTGNDMQQRSLARVELRAWVMVDALTPKATRTPQCAVFLSRFMDVYP